MSTHRIDFADTDIGYVHAAQASHDPVLRSDRAERPLASCCGDCSQGHTACPSPAVCMGLSLHRVELANGQTRSAADVANDRRVRRATRAVRFFGPNGLFWWILGFSMIAAFFTVPLMAHAAEAETTATIAAAADTGSTVAVVATGVGVEANALIAHPVVFAAVAVAKLAAPRLTRSMEPEQRHTVLSAMSGLWGGAAANNLALLAGAGCPPCIGVVAGIALWLHERGKPIVSEPISAPEPDAQLAMAEVAR